MKCPFCQQELHIFKSSTQDAIVCADCGFDGDTKLWQKLIRTRKALDVAVDALKRIDWCATDYGVAQDTLDQIKQITALEQKDVK